MVKRTMHLVVLFDPFIGSPLYQLLILAKPLEREPNVNASGGLLHGFLLNRI